MKLPNSDTVETDADHNEMLKKKKFMKNISSKIRLWRTLVMTKLMFSRPTLSNAIIANPNTKLPEKYNRVNAEDICYLCMESFRSSVKAKHKICSKFYGLMGIHSNRRRALPYSYLFSPITNMDIDIIKKWKVCSYQNVIDDNKLDIIEWMQLQIG